MICKMCFLERVQGYVFHAIGLTGKMIIFGNVKHKF